ncbi:hypothetical protein QJS10_CPB14g01029 [Acorus calamus]|uniref:Uncharacterized protein n=1 Tax=Acorus calamus TaxID=4465 RepID=A0AAV9DCQ1_ACOCL|nr:hypothetical protein QJS10_CPB14g01029 [Acorus calamus]
MQRKRRSGREGESACSSNKEGKVVCLFACEILFFLLQELSLAELTMIGFLGQWGVELEHPSSVFHAWSVSTFS